MKICIFINKLIFFIAKTVVPFINIVLVDVLNIHFAKKGQNTAV